ncbi:selenoneine biosynthesis selenosugar synthase SenB [Macromonas nakdongensis]|uniref:selenoneine biosynthesis selenosugar synthase SenB n=1 Tax=Macromonas nakdongensis TaxID=1843082 RepID=UPI000C33757A|nr:selenoneine biosynthesis selenosugar synthase SenB [Macromonas nakdongensis]
MDHPTRPAADRPRLCLVTPALADAANGNWQTARRWRGLLADGYRVELLRQWPEDASESARQGDLLLALHARRSAPSIAAWARERPGLPLVLALTGTDLYRDILHDASAQRSLDLAHRLVVLQDAGRLALPERWRDKCRVVYQSTRTWQTLPKTAHRLRVVMVGHLREEKWPQTLFAAARLVAPDEGICIEHIGRALEPALGAAAQATALACPHYRWLGELPHAQARRRIQRAHLLVHTSRMEGGAHVLMEAVCSGTPVLASAISGNVGMLGSGYRGYFPAGDAEALVAALRACRQTQTSATGTLADLRRQCAERAPLFSPERERDALLRVLAEARQTAQAAPSPCRPADLLR